MHESENKQSVAAQLDKAHKEQQQIRQQMLLKQLSSLQFLVHQGLAIRSHSELEGNLIQLLKLRAEDDPQGYLIIGTLHLSLSMNK